MSIAALRLRPGEVVAVVDSVYFGGLTSKVLILPHLQAALLTRGSAAGGLYAAGAILGGNHRDSPLIDFGSLVEAFPTLFRAAADYVLTLGADGKIELTLIGYDRDRGAARAVSFDAGTTTVPSCFEGCELGPGVWGAPALADRDWPQPDDADLVQLALDQVAHMRDRGHSAGGPLIETRITAEGVCSRVVAA